eukprot:351929-Chlamydomonas_euryale.AAC.3
MGELGKRTERAPQHLVPVLIGVGLGCGGRGGGKGAPVVPTERRLAWTASGVNVLMFADHCHECADVSRCTGVNVLMFADHCHECADVSRCTVMFIADSGLATHRRTCIGSAPDVYVARLSPNPLGGGRDNVSRQPTATYPIAIATYPIST